jgi:hypothetical protein
MTRNRADRGLRMNPGKNYDTTFEIDQNQLILRLYLAHGAILRAAD